MIVGYTGTRRGMTLDQVTAVNLVFFNLRPDRLHHGGCKGSDAQMHNVALSYGVPITVHPSNISDTQCDVSGLRVIVLEPKDPLVRNGDIVDEVQHLIAAPKEYVEAQRSGTWATIRRARKAGVPVTIVYPNGKREESRA